MIWSNPNLELSLTPLFLLHISNLLNKQYTGKPFGLYLKHIQNKTTSYTSPEVTLVRAIMSLAWIAKISS